MTGTVSIVGAGPGDPELLTVKARRRINTADIIFHDSLVGKAIIDSIPRNIIVDNVGKSPEGPSTPQEIINQRLVDHARAGQSVVRLKGGDPFVFGRGGEEIEYLSAKRIPVEIVPGISSAVAGPGVAGIPVTHRAYSSSLTVVTGHEDPLKESSSLDWGALSNTVAVGGTLVVLMGVGRLEEYMSVLLDSGVSKETPVAMIKSASTPDEFVIVGTIESISTQANESGIKPPAVTVIGEVVQVRESVRDYLNLELITEFTTDPIEWGVQ